VNLFIRKSSERVLAISCENLSNYYPIIMKFSEYLFGYEDTSAIDFGSDRPIALAGDAPKVGQRIRLL